MFLLSKILGWFTQPLLWLLPVLLASWVLSKRSPVCSRRLLGLGCALLLLLGWEPLPALALRQLEARYAEIPPDADLRAYVGVVVLGGSTESGRLQQSHRQPLLNDAAERLSASAAMALRHPHLTLLYTGGEGDPFGEGPSEAGRAAMFYTTLQVPAAQLRYESLSRNTFENATLSAQLPGIDRRQRWLLLTSAWHMPRAMATFEKAGWNVTAYPVDYRVEEKMTWTGYSLSGGAASWNLLLHELLGILVYQATGRL